MSLITPLTINHELPADRAEVPMVLLKRHMGLPTHAQVDADLSSQVRDGLLWCRHNANPWTASVTLKIEAIEEDRVRLAGGIVLASPLLAGGFAKAKASEVVVLVASAGPEIDQEIAQRWRDDKPDEAMCLNACAIATVEHYRRLMVENIETAARAAGLSALPFYSPGFEGWDLADQRQLFNALDAAGLPGPLSISESHQLHPAKSTIAVIGLTACEDLGESLDDLWAGYTPPKKPDNPPAPAYEFPGRALRKWTRNNLTLEHDADGGVVAAFRYEGSTCTNMGLPLHFLYRVHLQPTPTGGYCLADMSCHADGPDNHHEAMCAYQAKPESFLRRMHNHYPYLGRPLDEVLDWHYETAPSGCLCSRTNQNHKWRIVLQTIHFALNNNGNNSS